MKTIVLKGSPVECGAQLSENVLETPLMQMMEQQPELADGITYGVLSRLMALCASRCGIGRSIELLDMVKAAMEDVAKNPIATSLTDREGH